MEVGMKQHAALLLGLVLFAACSDVLDPMAPPPEEAARDPSAGEAVTGFVLAAGLPDPLAPVEDALERVLNGLPAAPARTELQNALAQLHTAIGANDGCGIRTSRQAAEHALRDLGKRAPADIEPDLDVVKLALESVHESSNGGCRK
jgi:hypothetical protein